MTSAFSNLDSNARGGERAVHPAPEPLLPDRLETAAADLTSSRSRALRAGCHLVQLTREAVGPGTVAVRYDGTLRVEHDGAGTVASGDLYLRGPLGAPETALGEEPDPGAGISIFPRSRYRYYLRATELIEAAGAEHEVMLGFELHRFDVAANRWTAEGDFAAELRRGPAPRGYPSRDDFLRGPVRDGAGRHDGDLTVGWVSPHLRRAVIQIDCLAGCEAPLANVKGADWRALLADVGWDITVVEGEFDLPGPNEDGWSDAELHAAMSAPSDSTALDSEWRFRLFCVDRLNPDERGRMFDAAGTDSNKIAREAAGIAAHWTIPDTDEWGIVRNMRFGTATDPYFRAAVHEIGHAMGLLHNTRDNGFMSPTDAISRSVKPPQQFPENVLWSYQDEDATRLRHLPDPWVRPGGIPYGLGYHSAPSLPRDAMLQPPGLSIAATPLLTAVPIGAPVRVAITLHNSGADDVPAPEDLSLKAGNLCGSVTDPAGNVRSFRSLVRRTDRSISPLARGEVRSGAATLLRGAEGALFPLPGPYTIDARLEWEVEGIPFAVSGEATVMVMAAVDEAHAEAALEIITTPDVLLTLALGGDHLEEGIAAVRTALANDVLRPHFAFTEARRLAARFLERDADLAAAAELIDDTTVMSADEIDKAARLLESAARRGAEPPTRLVEVIRAKSVDAAETATNL